jgi:hypothetical protein
MPTNFFQYGPPGLWHTPAYQTSGTPWISGSHIVDDKIQMMKFPNVARSVTIINTGSAVGSELRISFQSGSTVDKIDGNGKLGEKTYQASSNVNLGMHYIMVYGQSGSVTLDVKCDRVYIANPSSETGYVVIAELTGIPARSMFHLTGSGITDTAEAISFP